MLTCPNLTLFQTQDPEFCPPHPTQVTPENDVIKNMLGRE